MTDIQILALVLVLFVVLFASLYVFSSFQYSIEGEFFVVRWRLLGIVPFNRKRIPLEQIEDVRRFGVMDLFRGVEIWGTLLRGDKMIVVRRSGLLKRVYVTPPNAAMLRSELVGRTGQRKQD